MIKEKQQMNMEDFIFGETNVCIDGYKTRVKL